MKATVRKWGNSAAVRIPSAILRSAQLSLDEIVDVREEASRIVIEALRQKTYNLNDLLQAITPKDQHGPVNFGAPMGKEVW